MRLICATILLVALAGCTADPLDMTSRTTEKPQEFFEAVDIIGAIMRFNEAPIESGVFIGVGGQLDEIVWDGDRAHSIELDPGVICKFERGTGPERWVLERKTHAVIHGYYGGSSPGNTAKLWDCTLAGTSGQ